MAKAQIFLKEGTESTNWGAGKIPNKLHSCAIENFPRDAGPEFAERRNRQVSRKMDEGDPPQMTSLLNIETPRMKRRP